MGTAGPHRSDLVDDSAAEPTPLSETVANLRSALALMADKSLRLIVLESRLAALSLSTMLSVAVVVALLLFSAWIFCLAAAVIWLVGMGLTWELAMLAAAALNLLLSFPAMQLIRALSRRLMFSATRRQLRAGFTV